MRFVVVVVDSKAFAGVVMKNDSRALRPFLKWAGSKKQLLIPIKEKLLYALRNYEYETIVDGFLGSGAVMFMMINEFSEINKIRTFVANDFNEDLINCFKAVKSNVSMLIAMLKDLESRFRESKDGGEFYREIRAEFNDRSKCKTQVHRAANFIFLNHTCYNGLYRVNSSGEFNVPYGKNQKAKIFDEDVLRADSLAFRKHEVIFNVGDFEMPSRIYGNQKDKTLFYFDPPYRPLSKTANFSKYTKENFGESEQLRLARYCCELCDYGAGVVASNSDSGDDFYEENYKRFQVEKVQVVRMMNADVSKRGTVNEVLLSRFK